MILVVFLFFLIALVVACRRLPHGRACWQNTGALFFGILPVGPLLMNANRVLIGNVDAGSPLFTPVLEFSLPVVVTAVVSLFGLRFLARGSAME